MSGGHGTDSGQPALQPSPSQPAPMSATEGEGFSPHPVAIVS